MRLIDYLDKKLLLADLEASGKRDALEILVRRVAEACPELNPEQALRVLIERESLGTTGIGEGVAIPHGKLPDLPGLVILVARSKNGVDFEALDQKPCHFFFLLLAPQDGAGLHLRILAQISRLARNQTFCAALLEATDEDGLWSVLSGT